MAWRFLHLPAIHDAKRHPPATVEVLSDEQVKDLTKLPAKERSQLLKYLLSTYGIEEIPLADLAKATPTEHWPVADPPCPKCGSLKFGGSGPRSMEDFADERYGPKRVECKACGVSLERYREAAQWSVRP
jgi:hypothetical protein